MATKQTKITDYRPDPANPNKHTQRGVSMLEDSIASVGLGRSIVVDKNGIVLAGNSTQERAVDQGFEDAIEIETDGKQLVVVRRTDLDLLTDDTKARALSYFDNRAAETGIAWDAERLLADLNAGFDFSALFRDDELDALLASVRDEPMPDAGAQLDRAGELQQKWQVERGDLWAIGSHRLLCGDSTNADDVARVMGGSQIELVWTDPPYGVAVGDKNKFLNSIAPSNRIEENLENDTLDEPALYHMLCYAFDNAITHCLAGAAFYVAAPPGPLHILFGKVLKDRGIWRQTIQWVKNNATFSPLGVDYHWRAEPIFYGWLPNAAHRYHGGRQQDTVWEIDRPMASPEHPTMKPVELISRAVENSSLTNQIVYDPFGGSGTTMVACEQLRRQCRMIEIEPKYCAVILERMEQLTGKSPVRVMSE